MRDALPNADSLVAALTDAYGPPGRETGIRAALTRALRGTGAASVDALGNLRVHLPGKGPRLLLAAHLDAPGIIVTRVEPSGLGRVSILGTMAPGDWIGAIVSLDGNLRGVIGWDRPGDLKDGREVESDALFLDVGGGPKKRIQVGMVGALEGRAVRLGDSWCAGNLDDRAGCAALVAALRGARGLRYDLHVVFSAQSDLGGRGAATGTFGVEPDLAVVVDVAFAGESKGTGGITLGKGPCLGLKEPGFLAHPLALDTVKRAARSAGVKHQWLIRESGGSDARTVRASRAGVPTAVIAIPARRSGGPFATLHAKDLNDTAALVRQILKTPYAGEKGSR